MIGGGDKLVGVPAMYDGCDARGRSARARRDRNRAVGRSRYPKMVGNTKSNQPLFRSLSRGPEGVNLPQYLLAYTVALQRTRLENLNGTTAILGTGSSSLLTLFGPQSHFGDEPLKFRVGRSLNGSAVLNGLKELRQPQ